MNKKIIGTMIAELENVELNKILNSVNNYEIIFENINPKKSTFKTGFFSMLGPYAPLTIFDNETKKY